MSNQPNIAVVGAGVVGLTVAKLLQEQLNNCNITVIADKYNNETTSHVAAGIFRPGTSFKGPTDEITKRWIDRSWNYWDDILKTSEAPQLGVMSLSTYIFSKQNPHVTKNHLIEDLVPIYRAASEAELTLGPQGTKYGAFFSTLKVECESYLPYTANKIVEKGAKLVNGKVESFASLSNFDLVFNCAGMGAKYLCNDHDLVPIRGQVIKVRAPWVKMAFYGDYDTYIIPGMNGTVTLGGVRQYDSYNLDYCKHDAAAIRERCCELLPNLKTAEVVSNMVGLRPHRKPVRVEPEVINGLKVVHCYGHGGYGVMTAPGTAMDAVDIGVNFLRSNIRSKM
ncbi:D-amino acid oxidase 1 [Anticarsia gemmatalis]|uniref:D-amino acid oxidase 1 n=1 Tax=Anticarsia gemmatalis TaxID=129554 RepID=UPI003F771888